MISHPYKNCTSVLQQLIAQIIFRCLCSWCVTSIVQCTNVELFYQRWSDRAEGSGIRRQTRKQLASL